MAGRYAVIGNAAATNSGQNRSSSSVKKNTSPVPVVGHPHAHGASLLSPNRTRRRGSNHSSRSGSPLTLSMENVQSMNTAYNMSGTYLSEGIGSPSPSSSRSPYQSPAHSRSSSMTSVKSLLRDRSSDRVEREQVLAHDLRERSSSLVRDRSLDRQLDQHHKDTDRYHTFSGRTQADRGHERDYPLMGARSLERDQNAFPHTSNLVRSRSIDHEYLITQAQYLPSGHDMSRHSRDSLLLDMQSQMADMNKECAILQHELEASREKLSSSMNSIKTFWSPELKKERMIRKEENARFSALADQLKEAKSENEKLLIHMQRMDDLSSLSKDGGRNPCNASSVPSMVEYSSLRKDKDKQNKEVRILRKTIEEMELRIDTQKQTLLARDESIKKLMEMLQSRGMGVHQLEEDRLEMDRLRGSMVEEQRRVRQLEGILEQKDRQIEDLKQAAPQIEVLKLQAVLDGKNSQMKSSEEELKSLKDEVTMLRSEKREPMDHEEFDSLKEQTKTLKSKLETLQGELSSKDSGMCTLNTKLESAARQTADYIQHIDVLKEKITAKEQRADMLQADIDILQDRLQDKENLIEKKSKAVVAAQTDKKRVEVETEELQEHLDIKDRKIIVLQRKIDNLEEIARETDNQLKTTKSCIASLNANQSSTDASMESMKETVNDRDKQIERLKEQRERAEQEHQDELQLYQSDLRDLKGKVDQMQEQVDEKQHAVMELREETSSLKSERVKHDSRIHELEDSLIQKTEDVAHLEEEIKEMKEKTSDEIKKLDTSSKEDLDQLRTEVKKGKEDLEKAQKEADRLLEILSQMEGEKHEKDTQIKELQEQMNQSKQKMGTLKRGQQNDKKTNANLLEEARKREEKVSDDASQLKNVVKHKSERIEELEEALRESVRITAEREMLLAQQQHHLEHVKTKNEVMDEEMAKVNASWKEASQQVATLSRQLQDQEATMNYLQADAKHQLQDVYHMKQDAILAAISEKDAHIALLELAPNQRSGTVEEVEKLTKEKQRSQQQLKELTHNMMKLMVQAENADQSKTSLVKQLQGAPPEQLIQTILNLEHRKRRYQVLIDRLVASCLDIDAELLQGLPRMQLDQGVHWNYLRFLGNKKLLSDLSEREHDCRRLEDYVDILLHRIREARPEVLRSVATWLDASVKLR